MNEHESHADDLIRRLGEAFDDLPAVPEPLARAAREAFVWRRADAQLAELLSDSAESELLGVRGSSSDRRAFRYGAGDFVVRVHLSEESLVVIVEPPLSVVCRVVNADGSAAHRTDELGELVVDAPVTPVRLELDLPAGTTITPWITG